MFLRAGSIYSALAALEMQSNNQLDARTSSWVAAEEDIQLGRARCMSNGWTAGRSRRMTSLGQSDSLKSVTQPSSGSQMAQKV